MALTSFIPTLWSGRLEVSLRKNLVSEAGINHNYEGDVIEGGSVKINTLSDITVKDYTKGSDITYEDLSTTAMTMNIDHSKYFAIQVDDVDAVQVKDSGALMNEAMTNAAYQLAADRDYTNFGAMITEGTKVTGSETVTTAAEAKALLLKLKNLADKANIPAQNRVCFASPDFENLLLADTTINLAAPTADDSLKAGYIGKLHGIEVYSSNNIERDSKNYVILTNPIATTEASQISNVEALRSEKGFRDVVRGLDMSGRKVTIPSAVIVQEVSYAEAS